MRRRCGLLSLTCVLLAACGGGGGGGGGNTPPPITTLYVRSSGNDDATGTSPDRALNTVARAAELLAPGVIVYVGPGRYVGRIDITGIETTAAAPIELLADTEGTRTGDAPGEVILDGDEEIFTLRVSRTPFVVIDGFILTGAAPSSSDSATAIHVRSESNDVTIRNCVITNGGPADGIRVQNSNDVLIFNSLLFDNNRGIVINGSQRARIINNTLVENRATGIVIGGANADNIASTDAVVRNNVIQGSGNNVSIDVDDGPPSSRAGYSGNFNLAFAPRLGDQARTYRPSVIRGDDDVNEDALFADPEDGDFHLSGDSPGLDAGTDSIEPVLLSALLGRTTMLDNQLDAPPVDIGYHYPVVK